MTDDKQHASENPLQSRKAALSILLAVLKDKQSLSQLNHLTQSLSSRDAGFARMLSFGVLRYYHQLQAQLQPFIKKPLKAKDLDIQLIMLMAVYQLQHARVPDYAAVDAAVKQVRKSKKQWAAGMVNGVLRNFIRQNSSEVETTDKEAFYAHPKWMIDRLQQDWPETWQSILQANNQQAPMTLRVNVQKTSVDQFQAALQKQAIESELLSNAPAALVLKEAQDVTQLPGYQEGWFSVQDAGAQMAAQLLQPQAGERILDACAAPGGKTAHLFELQPDIKVTALDISEQRLQRVQENCSRLGFEPEIKVADAIDVDSWWDGEYFDKILLDVPCSATGVIRRHPDIKHLRREDDIASLQSTQQKILQANWPLLKPGGVLLYATCSLFKAENEQQVRTFLQAVDNAEIVSTQVGTESNGDTPGVQLFPTAYSNDGFYYALLRKTHN